MRTIFYKNKPKIIATSSICGPKEANGNLFDYIDVKLNDDTFNEESFEKAECKILYTAIKNAIKNSKKENIDTIISGDLLDQIIPSTFSARSFPYGYLGVYNACATFTEALALGGVLIDGKYMENVACATSSHFSSAERQYRYPLELGSTRPPQAQWTVTGAGACVLSLDGQGPSLTCATIGRVIDYGVTDANNMGAAMASAACDTILTHFEQTGRNPDYYDLIVTGDLGTLGSRIFKDLTWEKGVDLENQHVDCGELIYNLDEKEYQGGSGAGCSSLVFCSYLYKNMKKERLNKILLIATGALLSALSSQQGESIPGIAHAVALEN